MNTINDVDQLGRALPYGNFPTPIKVTRKVLYALRTLGAKDALGDVPGGVDWTSLEDVQQLLRAERFSQEVQGATDAADWIEKNPESCSRAILQQQGFEVKRFRIQTEYPDGDVIVLREQEDWEIVKRYSEELKAGWIARGWILKANDSKGIDVSRQSRNPATGQAELVRYCVLRIKAVGASECRRPTKDSPRYPDEATVKAWEEIPD